MSVLSRAELYSLVWSEPIQRLAPRYGLSDRGFAKLCVRYDVPVPPRGWWAKKNAGKRVKQPPLPTCDDPRLQRIGIQEKLSVATPEPPVADIHPLVAFEREPSHRLAVPSNLALSSPLVLKTERLLRRSKRDSSGLAGLPVGGLHIHTSRDQHVRALRMAQALLTAFETRNWPVTATKEWIRVTILEEALGFGIEEATKKIPHAITFTEQKLIDRGMGWQVPKTDSVPSGTLTAVITNVGHTRQRWAESPGKALEEQLNKFLVGLVRAALALKEQRAAAERRERERQEEGRRRAEAARRRKADELRNREELAAREGFDHLIEEWQESEARRAFLVQLRRAVGDADQHSPLGKWLSWAKRYVEVADPLTRFRARQPTLKLYYSGYEFEIDRIRERGFVEPEPPATYGHDKPAPPGIRLQVDRARPVGTRRPWKSKFQRRRFSVTR